jgi:hypothetical protein
MEPAEILDIANRWPVFPCNPLDKKPLTEHGFKDATKDQKQIKLWWRKWPNAMIGVPMGSASGIWAVDPDVPSNPGDPDGLKSWNELLAKHHPRHDPLLTRVHYTPSGGKHYLFIWHATQAVTNGTGMLPKGIDVRGEGGYIIVPPSTMADGRPYRKNEIEEIAEAPEWLYDLIFARKKEAEDKERKDEPIDKDEVLAALDVIPSNDYDTWFKIGGALRNVFGDRAFKVFKDWSAKSKKFNLDDCQRKWNDVSNIKDLTIGTIFFYADEADPQWRERYQEIKEQKERAKAGHWTKFFAKTRMAIADLQGREIPEQEWAVKDRIPLRHVCLYTGEGAAGKSINVLQLCVCHALNCVDAERQREWLGVTPRAGKAIFMDAEDEHDVIWRRLNSILEYYKSSYEEIAPHLEIITMVDDEDVALARVNIKTGKLQTTIRYDKLYEMAGDLKPVMIGIASAADVFIGAEQVRSEVQQFVHYMRRLAIVADGAVNLIAHPSLTGINTGTGISGSTAWHNSVRARIYLKTVKNDDGHDEGLREITFMKNQYGELGESLILKWQNGLFLPIEGQDISASSRHAVARNVFLRILRRFLSLGMNAGPTNGTSYAPFLFAKEREARENGCGKEILAQAMRTLMENKKILVEQYGKRDSKRFIINPVQQGEDDDIL